MEYDVAVVGGGLVGLATARALGRRRRGLRIVVVDKEATVAAHQSGHNSGVVHSGLYYRPGSLKARLCREGAAALEDFAAAHQVPYRRTGKLVVAVREAELPALEELRKRGAANGIEGITTLGPEQVRELEPNVAAIRALHVPTTGIIDFAAVARALAAEVAESGGTLLLGHAVHAIRRERGATVLATSRGDIRARALVTCAGLHADRVAALTDPASVRDERLVSFRGDYYTLVERDPPLVHGLVYPVPDPALPFLGVHFTRRIDGAVWAGPNAVLAFHREGYRRRDVGARDLAQVLSYRGFWRLARRHWRSGAHELWRDAVKHAFVADLQRYVPAIRAGDLRFGPSGVRAQAVRADGSMADDFSISEAEGVIHVRNAPSPAATACLAIGDHIAGRLLSQRRL